MKKFAFFLSLMVVLFFLACSDNDHDETTGKPGEGPGVINLAVTSRVGTHVGDDLTAYVKSLDLLLFQGKYDGIYLLRESDFLHKSAVGSFSRRNDGSRCWFYRSQKRQF